ncbi:MAG: formate/nitrite transporter family protein [Peptostreptococcaceae bacterium]
MADKKMLGPAEIAEYTIEAGIKKVTTPIAKVLVSAFLAGAYISLGAIGSMGAAYNLLANPATYGLGKFVAGLMFPTGLMFVLIAGAIVVAWLVSLSSIFNWSDGLFGGVVVKTAMGKVGFTWGGAIASGILCNWVVCATVWMTYGAKDVTGKVLTGFFGVFLFVCTGFEHCVANMCYLFAGLFSKVNPMFLEAAHKTPMEADVINISNMFINNLIPVTIGNILGGAIFVAGMYYFLYINKV